MKRIFLFILINCLIIATISAIISIFHLTPYISSFGLNYSSLMIFCLLWGMIGSFISLFLSKRLAIWMMRVKIIPVNSQNQEDINILTLIKNLSKKANIPMPEIGIYPSKDVNAFATGYSKKKSLIAISSALLEKMDQNELEGVLAHEISHISNGDMVTMTLLQGIVNAFVMFLARVVAYLIASRSRGRNNNFSYFSYIMLVFVFQFIFMLFGLVVISFFSRKREFKADMQAAKICGKDKMIQALQSLKTLKLTKTNKESKAFQALKISNPRILNPRSISFLFATHPPLEKRIKKLQSI